MLPWSPTYDDFKRFPLSFFFSQLSENGRLCWNSDVMVLWWVGEMTDWTVLLFTCRNEHYVCITAHHPLMMACIYTNTQTCTYTAHTVHILYTCTCMHICVCLDKIWVRPHHCDQPVGFVNIGGPKKRKKKKNNSNSMTHHQRGTLRKLVRLWKRSALSFLWF